MSSFMIGPSPTELTGLSELATPVPDPQAQYNPWPVVHTGGDGMTYGAGLPTAAWRWNILTASQRNQLANIISGKSSRAAIQTPDSSGTYHIYACIAHWPEEEDIDFCGVHLDFVLQFTHLVLSDPVSP